MPPPKTPLEKHMKKRRLLNNFGTVAGVLACVFLALATTSTAWAKDKLPEVSKDGLHLLEHTKVRVAYAKPGVSLDKYTKVKILDCFVQFEKNYEREYNLNEVGLDGRITDKDIATIKTRLAAEFKKEFTKVLTKAGHEVVDNSGPEVLLLRPAIINLDVTAPDTMRAGFSTTVVASAGQMTLYMELYDSASSELLARVIDPQAGRERGVANRVTNTASADQILRHWADLLSKHLGDLKQNVPGS
jgi:Protein of unknown function (DUF3313)